MGIMGPAPILALTLPWWLIAALVLAAAGVGLAISRGR